MLALEPALFFLFSKLPWTLQVTMVTSVELVTGVPADSEVAAATVAEWTIPPFCSAALALEEAVAAEVTLPFEAGAAAAPASAAAAEAEGTLPFPIAR